MRSKSAVQLEHRGSQFSWAASVTVTQHNFKWEVQWQSDLKQDFSSMASQQSRPHTSRLFFSGDTVCSMFIECSPSRSKSSNQLLRILVKQWILSLYAKSADLPERDLRCSSWKRVVDLSIKSKPTSQFAVVIISTK